jgi:hypothetical protein
VLGLLVAGFFLGLNSHGHTFAGFTVPGAKPELVAGAIRSAPSSRGTARFVLPVHNAGDEPVQVSVASVPGWPSPARADPVDLPPRTWSAVSFELLRRCAGSEQPPEAVTVDVRSAGETRRMRLGLPEVAEDLAELQASVCAAPTALSPDSVAGVWVVDHAFGRWTELEDEHVLVFGGDGTLVADPERVRFTKHRGVLGHYRLEGDSLIAVADGFVGYACLPGERATWRTSVLPDDRLVLTLVDGRGCPQQAGEIWVLRRAAPVPGT